jgi:non-ribosomal peptide synthase protein (TIGR01720 family)
LLSFAKLTQINDILLTALVQILAKWTGSNSVLLDLEGHGREDIFEDVDLSRTVGWFTTIFPWGRQENSFFKLAPESVGAEHSQEEICDHLLDINGLVTESQLKVDWTYSENFHQRSTIENLAEDFVVRLRSLIAHCLSIDADRYTPDVWENQSLHSLNQQINSQHDDNHIPAPLHLLELPEGISELLPEDTELAYPLAQMQ